MKIAGCAFAILLGLLSQAARAADQQAVDQAIKRGVAYLKRSGSGGAWTCQSHDLGATALAGLTLLECDLPPVDPVLQRVTTYLRNNARAEMATYDQALAILYFDRLGKPEDEPVLRLLTARLIQGQNTLGGWSYACPVEAAGSPGAPAVGLLSNLSPPRPGLLNSTCGDNSNTQFATLALWVSRRHQLPADQALAAVAQRFHSSQNVDGGWGYYLPPNAPCNTTATMTCAGLLGLAVGYGVAGEAVLRTNLALKEANNPKRIKNPRDPGRDPAVRAALLTLGDMINGPYAGASKGGPAGLQAPRAAAGRRSGPGPGAPARVAAPVIDYYLLWSIERVASAFGLRTLGRRDWFDWGANLILANQQADGSFRGAYDAPIETSFALLFLCRSNLVKDLTKDLQGLIRDPAEVRLRAGGVGGKGLRGQESGLETSAVGKSERHPNTRRPSSIPELRPDGDAAPEPGTAAKKEALDPEAARLSAAVVQASGAEQEALIDQLRDARGGIHTQALAAAIPELSGAAKTRARDALAERLTRMTDATLRDKFKDENLEIRRAAALAAAMKGETSFIPDLIELLNDPEPPVTRAAHAALKALTKEDFGPTADATRADRAEAITKWKAWWAYQKK
jgi:hypothetical protein